MTDRAVIVAIAILAAASGLAGCGKQAPLERPRPILGRAPSQPNAGVVARDAAAARARADTAATADPQAPQSVDEVRSPGPPPGTAAAAAAPASSDAPPTSPQ